VLTGLVIALVGMAVLGRTVPERRATGRHGAGRERRPEPRPPWVEDRLRRSISCVAGAAVVAWAVAGSVALPFGIAAGSLLSWWLGRLEPPSQVRRREAVQRQLPLAVDLLAACAEAGQPSDRALGVVAQAVPGPLGARLAAMSARLSLGVDPVAEWRRLRSDTTLAPLARTMLRSLESGAPLSSGLRRLAADRRRELRTAGQVRARRVGVSSAAPLGLCFLPAFMLIGVVPTVVGTFSDLVLH
jgi:Flp pilus assembly protein TadB